MIELPHGCYRSDINVTPSNWKALNVSMKKPWRITYRFYDPAYEGTELWGKQISLKGMNHLRNRVERQACTRNIIAEIRGLLEQEGFNPITGKCNPVTFVAGDIDEYTPFIRAVDEAFHRLTCGDSIRKDIERALVYIRIAIRNKHYDRMPVSEIKIRNIILVLDEIGRYKRELVVKENGTKAPRGIWSASNYNHYRSYLLMLFKKIVPLANMNGNPVKDVEKLKQVKKIRRVLTDDERELLRGLRENNYNFWRFFNVFFHSGIRTTELLRVQRQHVDLKKRRFKTLILKGREYKEVWTTIKDVAFPFWQELMTEAAPIKAGQPVFLFSKFLKPGLSKISAWQISKRWRIYAKERLGIEADFYALKHLHTTEVMDILEALGAPDPSKDLAAHNNHTSPAMVVQIYDVHREERRGNRVRTVNNPL